MSLTRVFATFYRILLKGRKGIFALFVLLVVANNIAFNLNPYFYKLFVEGIPSLNFDYLLRILIFFISIRFFAVVLDIVSFIVGDAILFNSARDARVEIFKHVGNLDFAFHTSKSTGSLISAFKRGDGAFFSFFHDIHARGLSVITGFFVMIFFLFQLNIEISMILIASIVATIIAAKFLVSNNVNKRKIFNKEEDAISGVITDNLINFETVKIFAKEKWEELRLTKLYVPWVKALWGYGNSFRYIDGVLGAIISISMFSVLYIALLKTTNQELSIGDFVLVSGFLSSFYPKLWDLVWSTRDLAKHYADMEKYFGLLDYKEDVLDPEKPFKIKKVKGLVEFINVCHSYKDGTKNAAKDFNLTINPGESIALVGRSGSGKTTITKLLMRFFDPECGVIKVDGMDIKNFNKSDLRNFYGVVPQEPVLFNNTIEYNIAYGADSKILQGVTLHGQVKRAAQMANIDKFIQSLPNKYKTNVGERGIKLSGGQKQRLAIARMILSNPNIIIFDEATSHLDSESEKLIQDAFWKVARPADGQASKTTIIVAHRLSTIKRADRIVVMDKGKIVEIGTHEDLLKKDSGIYKRLWDIQKQ